jgi:hypothetical protein
MGKRERERERERERQHNEDDGRLASVRKNINVKKI